MRRQTSPQLAKVPGIQNLTLTASNTEYSIDLPLGTVYAELHARTSVDVRVAFEEGKVASPTAPFWTLKADDFLTVRNAKLISNRTIYLASSNAGVVVELLTWSI